MIDEEFVPLNALETALIRAMKGEISQVDFLRTFVESDLAVPSSNEVQEDGSGMSPFFFDKEGVQMLAVYSHRDRIKRLGESARFCLVMIGRDFLARVPPGYGIVMNPGFRVGFDLAPASIRRVRRDFC